MRGMHSLTSGVHAVSFCVAQKVAKRFGRSFFGQCRRHVPQDDHQRQRAGESHISCIEGLRGALWCHPQRAVETLSEECPCASSLARPTAVKGR